MFTWSQVFRSFVHICIVIMQPSSSHDAALKRAYSPSLVCLVSVRGGSDGGPLTATRKQIDEVAASSCKYIVSATASCTHCNGEPVLACNGCKEMFCAIHLKMTLKCVLPCGCSRYDKWMAIRCGAFKCICSKLGCTIATQDLQCGNAAAVCCRKCGSVAVCAQLEQVIRFTRADTDLGTVSCRRRVLFISMSIKIMTEELAKRRCQSVTPTRWDCHTTTLCQLSATC